LAPADAIEVPIVGEEIALCNYVYGKKEKLMKKFPAERKQK
jgi:hypothetical protein